MIAMGARSTAETRLQMALINHLRLLAPRNILYMAIPNEGSRSPKTGARMKAMGMLPGAPDLLFIIDGKAHGLELKADKGRQSDTQRLVERAWEAAGGVYALAKGMDEALTVLRAWGALPADYNHVPARRRQLSLSMEAV